MTKREKVYSRFDGKCSYTGTNLESDCQIDHMESKAINSYYAYKGVIDEKDVNRIENLFPAQRIINHYKRGLDLELFRDYMKTFHLRLAKLPKNPKVKKSIKHKEYLLEVARLFDITPEKPFSGKFYFETLKDGSKHN